MLVVPCISANTCDFVAGISLFQEKPLHHFVQEKLRVRETFQKTYMF